MKTVDKKRARTAKGVRRRYSRWMSQLFRGLVLEGLGMAVLAYLFFTVQSVPPNTLDGSPSDAGKVEFRGTPPSLHAERGEVKNAAYQGASHEIVNKLIPTPYGAAFWNLGR